MRIEKDSLGEIEVAESALWGAQTERSRRNFKIGAGHELMPTEIIEAITIIKKACAVVNNNEKPDKMTSEKKTAIVSACDKVLEGELWNQFPLVVYQTGSGTQTNMNVNEVIAHIGNKNAGSILIHPNDDVNMSQSSNDVFPSAIHIALIKVISGDLIPALDMLANTFRKLENENTGLVKCGRTHLQDAVPIAFSQEVSGWRTSVEKDREMILDACRQLYELPIGGTAVGTGLNAPANFGENVCSVLNDLTGFPFKSMNNKFHGLSSKGEIAFVHGSLKTLAADLMKIANDVRFLASGPRNGYGEITIPSNEPGSSIMPGKINPTQCEAVTMVAVQVLGNDATVSFAASQGNFELNVFMPVIAYNSLQSVRLLAEVVKSFNDNCVSGIKVCSKKMEDNLNSSLMCATILNPYIGYDNAAKAVKYAFEKDISLKEACINLGLMTGEYFDSVYKPCEMI